MGLIAGFWLATAGTAGAVGAVGTAGSAPPPSDTQRITVAGVVDEIVVDPQDEFDASARALHAAEASDKLTTKLLVDARGTLIDVPPADASSLRDGDPVSVTLDVPAGMSATTALREIAKPGASTVAVASVDPAPAVAATTAATVAGGAHTLTILPVYWSSRDSATQASLTTIATQTAQFWADQSGGQISTATTVRDWAQVADPGTCDYSTLYNEALAAHHRAAPTTIRDHIVVYFPNRSDCGGWAGLGSINGSKVWVNGYPRTDVVAHEMGHNLGLGHANQLTCTSGAATVPLSSTCTMREYYDGADVMGYSTGQAPGNVNTALAFGLGFVQAVDASPSAPVTVDLAALGQVGQVRAVRVPTWDGIDLYVDFRPAVGRDLRIPAWAGVQVHRQIAGYPPTSQLVNMQAGSGSGVSMAPGTSYAIPRSDYTVTVLSVGATTARVRVAVTSHPPIGVIDSTQTTPGRVSAGGWALDPDSSVPVIVQMYVDSQPSMVLATISRPDVGVAYPAAGPNHGFSISAQASAGSHAVCLYAIKPAGGTTTLGCRTLVVPPPGQPLGHLDSLGATRGLVTASGWALDPNRTGPVIVQMYLDTGRNAMGYATTPRADLTAAFPDAGANHGFSLAVSAPAGRHTACLYAISPSAGLTTALGCRTVDVPDGSPFGRIDALAATPGSITAGGWAIDPKTSGPIIVQMYVDSRSYTMTAAAASRPDVGAYYPSTGPNHGYTASIPAAAGRHDVCVYAINSGDGPSTALGCRSIVVPDGSPFGQIDNLSASAGTVSANGWAIDPETSGPILVQMYLDGTTNTLAWANRVRSDVGLAYPASGPNHGYAISLSASRGPHTACVYAINTGLGASVPLGCRAVTVS